MATTARHNDIDPTDIDPTDTPEYREYLQYLEREDARGELAGAPDAIYCPTCETDNTVVKLGPTVGVADPTRTYVLDCGHTVI